MSDQAVKFQRGKRIDRTLPRTLAPRRPRAGGGPRSLGAIGREGLKALLLERVHQGAHEILAAAGISVEAVGKALGREELRERLRGCHLLGIRSKTQLNAELLAGAEDLLAVGCFCIGTNQVDVDAAGQLGIPVFNAPHSNTRSVAEMIVAELILLSRRLGDRSGEVHGGRWRKVSTGCFEVRGKTLGIVGYGNIGSQVGILGEALGMRILYHDIVSKLSIGGCLPCGSLHELLRQSDFVTLHVPGGRGTERMIGAEQLRVMKRGSYLLNASRGTVVDLPALADALRAGHLAGAAVDVYPDEPEQETEAFDCPLRGLPNVVLTPHIGGSTEEAQAEIGRVVATSLVNYLGQGDTTGAVNVLHRLAALVD